MVNELRKSAKRAGRRRILGAKNEVLKIDSKKKSSKRADRIGANPEGDSWGDYLSEQ